MFYNANWPVRKDVEQRMNQTELSAHEVSVADLLVEAFVIELDDPVDGVSEHGLELGDLLRVVVATSQRRFQLSRRTSGDRRVHAVDNDFLWREVPRYLNEI